MTAIQQRLMLYCVLTMLLVACASNQPVEIEGETVLYLENESEAIKEAQKRAQGSWPRLISYLDWDNCFLCECLAKRNFMSGDTGEHMWVGNLDLRNDTLWGVLSNKPIDIHNIAEGDTTFVTKDMMEDWVCFGNNGIALGNFLEELRKGK